MGLILLDQLLAGYIYYFSAAFCSYPFGSLEFYQL